MQDVKEGVSLRERPFDWLFIIFFSFFAWISFFTSPLRVLNVPLTPDGKNFLLQGLYWYGSKVDPLYIFNPSWYQTVCFIDGFIYGPFYLFLIYALVKGKNWIRLPALLYVSAITCSTSIAFGTEYFGDSPPLNIPLFLAFKLLYFLVPFALGYRMRHPYPFSNTDCAKN